MGCGKENPCGLKLEFSYGNGFAVTESVLGRMYEGYENIVHGGIISLVLDEVSAKAVIEYEGVAVTARIQVSFIKPLMCGVPFTAQARIESVEGRKIFVKGELKEAGVLIARSESVFIKVGE